MTQGDRVKWTSQSAGVTTTKRGVIVAVIPPGMEPEMYMTAEYHCGSPDGFGMRRFHESYLVKVDGKGRGLYWPRVKHLEIEHGSAAEAQEEYESSPEYDVDEYCTRCGKPSHAIMNHLCPMCFETTGGGGHIE